jgi:hypothetical protein
VAASESTPEYVHPDGVLTQLAQAAVTLHELFLSLQSAGFSRDEALYLVGQRMKGTQ